MSPITANSAKDSPAFSFDGYFRMTFDAFIRLTFIRKLAWEDTDVTQDLRAESISAHRAGYCEWVSEGRCPVSVGWTWFEIDGGSLFVSPTEVNSNLMFVDNKHYDLGASKTSELLRAWLSGVVWRPEMILKQFQTAIGPQAVGLIRNGEPLHESTG